MGRVALFALFALAGCHDAGLPGPGGDGGRFPDAAPASGGEHCVTVVECVNGCASNNQPCVQACIALGTPSAQTLMMALIGCLTQQCPRTPGGVCDGGNGAACDACLNAAQAQGGACDGPITACDED